MNFTNSPFERMMRQRPGTDSGHPCKHCRHKWECGYLLHQCRKKFRSVLGDTAPQGVRLHDAPVQKEISFGLWRYGSPGIRHSQCLMPFG